MKMKTLFALIFALVLLAFAPKEVHWTKIGDLTMISTRNIDSNTKYNLIATYRTGRGKSIDDAIDDCLKRTPGGEYLKNVKIFEKGTNYEVEGDVWGTGDLITNALVISVGDSVTFNDMGFRRFGKVIGRDEKYFLVEYVQKSGKKTAMRISSERLTKINK